MDKNAIFITPKELYDLTVKNGVENQPIYVDYVSADSWYDYEGNVKKDDVSVDTSGVSIFIFA